MKNSGRYKISFQHNSQKRNILQNSILRVRTVLPKKEKKNTIRR